MKKAKVIKYKARYIGQLDRRIKRSNPAMKLSAMNGKLADVPSISWTSPASVALCAKRGSCGDPNNICTHCFSAKTQGCYKDIAPMMARNGQEIRAGRAPIFQVPEIFDRFRWQSFGETCHKSEVRWAMNVARANPHCAFAFWTKNAGVVSGLDCPENMILVFSNDEIDAIMEEPPKGFDKVFNVIRPENTTLLPRVNCGAEDCRSCVTGCYSKRSGEKVIVEILK